MKRTISLFVILAMITTVGSAQYFVEGSVYVDYNDTNVSLIDIVQNKKMSSDVNYNVSPTVGYQLNDDFALGVKASFSARIYKRILQYDTGDIEFKESYPLWDFGVFCRYKLWGTKKLSLLVEGFVYIGGGNAKEKTGPITKKTESRSSIGFNATPLVTYDISDKWSIVTTFGFFNFLTLGSVTWKNEETGLKTKYDIFDFSADSSFSLNSRIGFIYYF